jgi:hypothetical protein
MQSSGRERGDKVDLPEELLADGEMIEPKKLDEAVEALDIKDLPSALLVKKEFEDPELEDKDD